MLSECEVESHFWTNDRVASQKAITMETYVNKKIRGHTKGRAGGGHTAHLCCIGTIEKNQSRHGPMLVKLVRCGKEWRRR